MIEFPENEMQTYRYTLRNTQFMVTCTPFGNHEVYYADSPSMPSCMESCWIQLQDWDIDYWTGIVYAYKMTDDTTHNVYDSTDYRMMGCVCQKLKQIPEFEELERIIGYNQSVNTSEYLGWADRATAWLRRQQLLSIPAFPNPLAEGAD